MKALNLYVLSRYTDAESYAEYYRAMSECEKEKRYSKEEIDSLKALVDMLLAAGAGPELFENFFYGFEIPQIGKEFDILKIGAKFLLNIELKSRMDVQRAKAQLVKNKFYLRHLSDREQFLITFDAQNGKLFELTGSEELYPISVKKLMERMEQAAEAYDDGIERLFSASRFLVSPLNTPERFLAGEYFLTLQQQEVKDAILKNIDGGTGRYFAISGAAGTGKTLLIYDIAKVLAGRGKVCMIHCGQLTDGHRCISEACENIDIIPALRLKEPLDTGDYRFIMIDETQRIYKGQFEKLLEQLELQTACVIFAYDPKQTLSRSEAQNDIPALIEAIGGVKCFELAGKVRTNPELAAFIAGMGNAEKINRNYFYRNVELLYANSVEEAQNILDLYWAKGYQFINHTPSQYESATLDLFDTTVVAHSAIGQEFDKVIVMIDDNFYYENGVLRSKDHPNWNYLYHQMLFQEMTRVRERLAIIVMGNPEVFSRLLKIKNIHVMKK